MQNIKNLRKEAKLSQSEFAKMFNVHQTAVSQWEQGRTTPDIAIALDIAEKFGVSLEYVLDKTEQKNTEKPIDYEKLDIRPIKTKKFRMIGTISCGNPIYAEEDYETFVEASADINADFCVTAKGDSMINARIFDGDVVFIREQPDVENGEIAAVIIEDTVTLKRVYKYSNRIELRPENPTHKVQNYEGEELENIRIIGKAVAFQSYIL